MKLTVAAINVTPIEIKFGDFSNEIKQLVKSSDIAISLDDSQFLICKEISRMKDEDPLKDDCKRVRLQIILGINQLRIILDSLREQPTNKSETDLAEWVKFMSKLHKQSILLLRPGHRGGLRKGNLEIAQIMKYQRINEAQIQEAIRLM